jgi:hypothetical protein
MRPSTRAHKCLAPFKGVLHFVAPRSKALECFASRIRKGSPIFLKSSTLRKWETCTDPVRIEKCTHGPTRGALY